MGYTLILIFTLSYKGGIVSIPMYTNEATCDSAGQKFLEQQKDNYSVSYSCLPIDKPTP